MEKIKLVIATVESWFDRARATDFLAPLALRLYLVPPFLAAGINKFNGFEGTVEWFGNPDWGLGLPLPTVMAFLATSTELVGAIFLLFGFAVRWVSIPMMFTMLVAIFSVHWHNGWQAIADSSFCLFNCEDTMAAGDRLAKAREILQEYGNYEWLTEHGSFAILNNGVEFAVTYFVMLLALFYIGAGKLSIDHLLKKK